MSSALTAPLDPITTLRSILLRHNPPAQARMTEPGYTAKYLRDYTPITDADLAAHLAGEITLAYVLQSDGLAYVAAVDLDSGGEEAVRRVMQTAEGRACHPYGFALDSGGHQGGHVWLFFDQAHDARTLQSLMREIVIEAGHPNAEVYPSGADLRLPFGLHRRCHRRGSLLLNSSAAPFDLDADLPGALGTFLAQVRLTSDLPVRVAQQVQEERRREVAASIAASRPRPCSSGADWREVIDHFNRSTNLVSLLEGYGARVTYYGVGGKVQMRCACGQDHAHGDARPSLIVEPGRGKQTGKQICGCYTPSCRLHNQPGEVMDSFEVYCRLENISKKEGVRRLQSSSASARNTWLQQPVVGDAPSPAFASSPTPRPTLSSQPEPSSASAPTPTQELLRQLADDRRIQPLDRRLLAYVVAHGAQGQSIANAAIAAALGAGRDSIKRSKRRLKALGYIDVAISSDGVHGSVITLRGGESEGMPPPSHVSNDTCIEETPPPDVGYGAQQEAINYAIAPPAQTPPPESSETPPPTTSAPLAERPEAALRKRRAVLVNMLRAGQPERRRFAFNMELEAVEEELRRRAAPPPALLPPEPDGASYQEPQPVEVDEQESLPYPSLVVGQLRLADPAAPHPPLSDEQLTALLRDRLPMCLAPSVRPLLERVSWKRGEAGVMLICVDRDLVPVRSHLLMLAGRVLADLGQPSVMRVQIGQPTRGAGVWPEWVGAELWPLVPVWLRSYLVGARIIDGVLYGATPEATAALASHPEAVACLLEAVVERGVDESAGGDAEQSEPASSTPQSATSERARLNTPTSQPDVWQTFAKRRATPLSGSHTKH